MTIADEKRAEYIRAETEAMNARRVWVAAVEAMDEAVEAKRKADGLAKAAESIYLSAVLTEAGLTGSADKP